MKKVLIVITTSFVSYGGLTTVMMNYYRAMNKDGLHIDFASTNEISDDLKYELDTNKSNYYCLGTRKGNLISYLNKLSKIILKEKYDVVHVNGNSATMAFELCIAKLYSVPIRIAHGHTTQSNYPLLHKCLNGMFKKTYNCAVAVSKQVGDWLFKPNEYIILNNAIDVERYKHDSGIRDNCRIKLGLDDKFVLGHVGKMNASKNHAFLLRLFSEIHKKDKNTHLLLVGGGELQRNLEEQCKELNIVESVSFLGIQENVSEYLQAMDIFVFPSSFEGLGLALIEAQASGLHCIASDVVPKETEVTENIEYISLNEKLSEWVARILRGDCNQRLEKSMLAIESIKLHGYNINYEAYKLEEIYKAGKSAW